MVGSLSRQTYLVMDMMVSTTQQGTRIQVSLNVIRQKRQFAHFSMVSRAKDDDIFIYSIYIIIE